MCRAAESAIVVTNPEALSASRTDDRIRGGGSSLSQWSEPENRSTKLSEEPHDVVHEKKDCRVESATS
jgi:septum formation inhibitor-activating ATPase MinD